MLSPNDVLVIARMKPRALVGVRKKYQLTQEQWAKLLVIPKRSIENWELGLRGPSAAAVTLYEILRDFPGTTEVLIRTRLE